MNRDGNENTFKIRDHYAEEDLADDLWNLHVRVMCKGNLLAVVMHCTNRAPVGYLVRIEQDEIAA